MEDIKKFQAANINIATVTETVGEKKQGDYEITLPKDFIDLHANQLVAALESENVFTRNGIKVSTGEEKRASILIPQDRLYYISDSEFEKFKELYQGIEQSIASAKAGSSLRNQIIRGSKSIEALNEEELSEVFSKKPGEAITIRDFLELYKSSNDDPNRTNFVTENINNPKALEADDAPRANKYEELAIKDYTAYLKSKEASKPIELAYPPFVFGESAIPKEPTPKVGAVAPPATTPDQAETATKSWESGLRGRGLPNETRAEAVEKEEKTPTLSVPPVMETTTPAITEPTPKVVAVAPPATTEAEKITEKTTQPIKAEDVTALLSSASKALESSKQKLGETIASATTQIQERSGEILQPMREALEKQAKERLEATKAMLGEASEAFETSKQKLGETIVDAAGQIQEKSAAFHKMMTEAQEKQAKEKAEKSEAKGNSVDAVKPDEKTAKEPLPAPAIIAPPAPVEKKSVNQKLLKEIGDHLHKASVCIPDIRTRAVFSVDLMMDKIAKLDATEGVSQAEVDALRKNLAERGLTLTVQADEKLRNAVATPRLKDCAGNNMGI